MKIKCPVCENEISDTTSHAKKNLIICPKCKEILHWKRELDKSILKRSDRHQFDQLSAVTQFELASIQLEMIYGLRKS